MSKSSKIKGNSLYKKMKASREQLVKKCEAAGTVEIALTKFLKNKEVRGKPPSFNIL